MKTLFWYALVLIAELSKGKLKPVLAYVIDPDFRRDVEALRPLIGYRIGTYKQAAIPFKKIKPSHKVHYQEYVTDLTLEIALGRSVPPITCVKVGKAYKVINGNHRYYAMSQSGKYHPAQKVTVNVYKPLDLDGLINQAING